MRNPRRPSQRPAPTAGGMPRFAAGNATLSLKLSTGCLPPAQSLTISLPRGLAFTHNRRTLARALRLTHAPKTGLIVRKRSLTVFPRTPASMVGLTALVYRLAGGFEACGGGAEVVHRSGDFAVGLCTVAFDLGDCGVPRGEAHHDGGEVLGELLPSVGPFEVAGGGGRDRGRDGQRDSAAGTGLDWPAYGVLGLLDGGESGLRIGGGEDPGSVDAVEEVKADVRLAGDRQRLVQQLARLGVLPSVERDFGSAVQR